MNPLRVVLAIVLGCCLLHPGVSNAQSVAQAAPLTAAPAYTMDKQFSADVTVTTKTGLKIQAKTYVDNDKMRSEMEMGGMTIATILRKDQKKLYHVLDSQKMVMASDFDPAKYGAQAGAFVPDGKFDVVGAETINGIPCTKLKVTSNDGKQVSFLWIDATSKVPVQVTSLDGSFNATIKNYKAGPQDAALFEVPAGYQVMAMPAMGGMPGGGGMPGASE